MKNPWTRSAPSPPSSAGYPRTFFPPPGAVLHRETFGNPQSVERGFQVVTAANASHLLYTFNNNGQDVGYVTYATILPDNNNVNWPAGGSIYCQLAIMPLGATSIRQSKGLLWSGYVRRGEVHDSYPNAYLDATDSIVLFYTTGILTEDGATLVGFNLTVNYRVSPTIQTGGGQPYTETPLSGPGTFRTIATAATGIGNFFILVSPATDGVVAWKWRSAQARYDTDATLGARQIRLRMLTFTAAEIVRYQSTATIPVSDNTTIYATLNTVESANVGAKQILLPIPDVGPIRDNIFNNSLVLEVSVYPPSATDPAWQAGQMVVEEWALPAA